MAFRALSLLVLLLVAPTASAQTTGTILGTVTDAQTAAPLSDVAIVVLDARGLQVATAQARTSATGGYTVFGAPVGTFFVKALSPAGANYVPQLYAGIPCAAADCVIARGTPVTVTPGAVVTADFALALGGGIAGTLRRSETNAPIQSPFQGRVSIYNEATSLVQTRLALLNGEYSVQGLPAGRYFVLADSITPFMPSVFGFSGLLPKLFDTVTCSGSPCVVALGKPVTVTAGSTTSGIDITLDPGGRISGTFQTTAPGGTGPTTVCASTAAGTSIACAGVGGSGTYTIAGLPTGVYRVRASSLAPNSQAQWYPGKCGSCLADALGVPVSAGATASGIDFSLDFNADGTGDIDGTVTIAGLVPGAIEPSPIPNIQVFDAAGSQVSALSTSVSFTGDHFAFRFSGLEPGTYFLRTVGVSQSPFAIVDELFGDVLCIAADCDVRRGAPVRVTAGATTSGVNFQLTAGGQIQGALPAQISGVVQVYDARGVLVPGRTPTLSPGSYTAVGLAEGAYYLKLAASTAAVEQIYGNPDCGGCAVTSGKPVVVRDGQTTTGIDFASTTGRVVSGVLRDAATSAPLSTIAVDLVTVGGRVFGSALTDQTGRYSIGSVPAGTYFARTTNARGYVDERYNDVACGGCGVAGSTPIVVTASADVTNVDFDLTAGTIVTGSIKASDGAVLPGSAVGVFVRSTGAQAARVVTDSSGLFTTAVAAGTYAARTGSVPGYTQELYQEMPCPNGSCDPAAGTPIVAGATPVRGIDFTLEACPAISIAPAHLANAAVGSAYRQTLTAAAGTPPFRWTIAAGSLPPGLVLDATTGVIAGTPTDTGAYTVTVCVSDASGCASTRDYTLDVPPCAFVLQLAENSVPGRAQPKVGSIQPLILVSTTVRNGCGAWSATTADAWLHITAAGPSLGFVDAFVDPNPSATPRTGFIFIGPRVFTVHQSGNVDSAPFGVLDTPADGAQVSGSVAVTGWALDDVGVAVVQIYRDSVPPEPPGVVFIGNATFVEGARPDVEQVFPNIPRNRRAGWGYLLLTNFLPNGGNGTFKVSAYAEDNPFTSVGQGPPPNRTLLGTRTIVAANSTATLPFGAIDTPGQGATVSGNAFVNFGWALTPKPQTIPTDGSTIQVIVDGVPLGTVTYNLFRSDVTGLFPNFNNSAGPVGFRIFDTTSLEDGMHTIAWLVTDDGGRAQGIGSRFFNVNNSAWTAAATAAPTTSPADVAPAIGRGAGVDLDRRAASLDDLPLAGPGHARPLRSLGVRPMERIELDLTEDDDAAGGCAPNYSGYSSVNGELRELPIGSSLDSAGRFYWQPGPGFVGRYDLVFVRTACDGARERIPVTVTIAK